MASKRDVIDWLRDWLELRSVRYSQLQECNGFTADDDEEFRRGTEAVEKTVTLLEETA